MPVEVEFSGIQVFGRFFLRPLCPASLPFITLSPLLGLFSWLATAGIMPGVVISCSSLACGVFLMIISKIQFISFLMKKLYKESSRSVDLWISKSTSAAAKNIDENFLKELSNKMTLSLSPRTLQRLMLGDWTDD